MEEQEARPDSVLNFYRKLTALKKSPTYKETFTYGEFVPDHEDQEGIFAYHRKTDEQDILVAANYGTGPCMLSNVGTEDIRAREIAETGAVTLESCEALVLLLG